jgi:Protein of unknown function (DUF4013)
MKGFSMKVERSFTFAFRAPQATKKIFRGVLFCMLFFTVFFAFVVVGYVMRILCDVLEGRDARLPEWDNLMDLFNEGLQPVLIILVYLSPIILMSILEIQLAGMGLFLGVVLSPLELALGLLVSIALPIALIRSVVIGSLKAAFDFGPLFDFVKSRAGTYFKVWAISVLLGIGGAFLVLVLAILTGLLFKVAGGPGLAIGVFLICTILSFAFFISSVVAAHLYAQAYRLSKPFVDDRDGEIRASIAVPPPLHK